MSIPAKYSLADSFGRPHHYLRISLTDRCNYRCLYCMPNEKVPFMPKDHLMNADEIFELAKCFTELGIDKIRLTGGEPMMRADFIEIIERLSQLPASLHMTTNAYFLDQHIDQLDALGMRSVNISLDSLRDERNKQLTQREGFHRVQKNIQLAIARNWHVKLNVVVMKGQNEDELKDFVALTKDAPIHVRFIEFMPFKGNDWELAQSMSYDEIVSEIRKSFEMERLSDDPNDTAKNFRVPGSKGTFAVISSVTNPFCDTCNRIRLTADGKIRNCLFSKDEINLLEALRAGENYQALIQQNIKAKHFARGGHLPFSDKGAPEDYKNNRTMISIGG